MNAMSAMFGGWRRRGDAGLLAILALAGLLLSACGTGGTLKADRAIYDLFGETGSLSVPASGSSAAVLVNPPLTTLQLRLAEVQTPAWLNTPAMQYRLAYAEPERRQAYAGSRWAAVPAELIEQVVVRQNIAHKGDYEAGGCQLHLGLDEFIQKFETPERSVALLEVRATVRAPGGWQAIARRSFRFAPLAGSDAKSGVAGFMVAARELNQALNDWLIQLAQDRPEAVAACRA